MEQVNPGAILHSAQQANQSIVLKQFQRWTNSTLRTHQYHLIVAEAYGACCNPGTKHRWNKWTARIDRAHHSISPPSCSLRDCQNNLVFGVTTQQKNQKNCSLGLVFWIKRKSCSWWWQSGYHLFFSSSSQRWSNVTNTWEPSNAPDMAQRCDYLGKCMRINEWDKQTKIDWSIDR